MHSAPFVEGASQTELANRKIGIEQAFRKKLRGLPSHLFDGNLDRRQVTAVQLAPDLLPSNPMMS